MTTTVNVAVAKAQLSALLARAVEGEDIVIARNGRPLARLQPVDPPPPRELGFLDYKIPDELFTPLTEEELKDWE